MEKFTFEKLDVWQKARVLVKDVYRLSSKFPYDERFGLTNQLNRAVVSVPSNIAEGCGRPSYKERIHFLEIAYGSLMEAMTQIILASDLNYINIEELNQIRAKIIEIAKMINGLRKNLLTKIATLH
ncbi:MAG: four helix bundle protein [Muribaculaceae bacterium]